MTLEVHALSGRVRRHQDPHRMAIRGSVEGLLDLRPGVVAHASVELEDPAFSVVGVANGCREEFEEVALGISPLGEDDHPSLAPRLARGCVGAEAGREAGVLAEPGGECQYLSVWDPPRAFSRRSHLGQQRPRLRGGHRERGALRFDFSLQLREGRLVRLAVELRVEIDGEVLPAASRSAAMGFEGFDFDPFGLEAKRFGVSATTIGPPLFSRPLA